MNINNDYSTKAAKTVGYFDAKRQIFRQEYLLQAKYGDIDDPEIRMALDNISSYKRGRLVTYWFWTISPQKVDDVVGYTAKLYSSLCKYQWTGNFYMCIELGKLNNTINYHILTGNNQGRKKRSQTQIMQGLGTANVLIKNVTYGTENQCISYMKKSDDKQQDENNRKFREKYSLQNMYRRYSNQ